MAISTAHSLFPALNRLTTTANQLSSKQISINTLPVLKNTAHTPLELGEVSSKVAHPPDGAKIETYQSVEAAYQAKKSQFAHNPTQWHAENETFMRRFIMAKALQHHSVRDALLSTGDAQLVSQGTDAHWNKLLPEILMDTRDFLKNKLFFYKKGEAFYTGTNFYANAPFKAMLPGDTKIRNWPTSEAYFQARKYAHFLSHPTKRAEAETVIKDILSQDYPSHAFKAGRNKKYKNLIDPQWHRGEKDKAMGEALRHKFKDPAARRELLATGNRDLVENTSGAEFDDAYWGIGRDGTGENQLGKALMKERALIQSETTASGSRQNMISTSLTSTPLSRPRTSASSSSREIPQTHQNATHPLHISEELQVIQSNYDTVLTRLRNMTPENLEQQHDFIQYAFPTSKKSSVVGMAPTLSPQAINNIQKEELSGITLRTKQKEAFKILAENHFGLKIYPDHIIIKNKALFKQKLAPGNHNNARVSRILRSLNEFGNNELSKQFMDVLETQYSTDSTMQSSLIQWRGNYKNSQSNRLPEFRPSANQRTAIQATEQDYELVDRALNHYGSFLQLNPHAVRPQESAYQYALHQLGLKDSNNNTGELVGKALDHYESFLKLNPHVVKPQESASEYALHQLGLTDSNRSYSSRPPIRVTTSYSFTSDATATPIPSFKSNLLSTSHAPAVSTGFARSVLAEIRKTTVTPSSTRLSSPRLVTQSGSSTASQTRPIRLVINRPSAASATAQSASSNTKFKLQDSNNLFSTYYPRPITVEGITYPTPNHLYQSLKFMRSPQDCWNPAAIRAIQQAQTGSDATTVGRSFNNIDRNWDSATLHQVKINRHDGQTETVYGSKNKALYKTLKAIYRQHPEFATLLDNTPGQILAVDSPENVYGKMLMRIRDESTS